MGSLDIFLDICIFLKSSFILVVKAPLTFVSGAVRCSSALCLIALNSEDYENVEIAEYIDILDDDINDLDVVCCCLFLFFASSSNRDKYVAVCWSSFEDMGRH